MTQKMSKKGLKWYECMQREKRLSRNLEAKNLQDRRGLSRGYKKACKFFLVCSKKFTKIDKNKSEQIRNKCELKASPMPKNKAGISCC